MWRNRTWLMVPVVLIALGAMLRATPVAAAGDAGANSVLSTVSWIGFDGQQIQFQDARSDVYRVCVVGPNQAGLGTTLCYDTAGPSTELIGGWWKGQTYILEYGLDGQRIRTQSTNVPVISLGSHWCFSDRGDGAGGSC